MSFTHKNHIVLGELTDALDGVECSLCIPSALPVGLQGTSINVSVGNPKWYLGALDR